ncbi:asparaginase [Polynucleobacter sp. HIN6]|uniref:asparaginase n=1 Tax=Polynucleobacter sp. HIN6 TaxID=3047865 RepID=UPI002572B14F|nr:asparaginase [Polynucleobacter sp. HIN6]BEI34958.1 asparaginase [Polynucleobacter sp. HIN6]
MLSSSISSSILVIGTGGTIAGLRTDLGNGGYQAGQVPISTLLTQINSKFTLKNMQLSNIDSCDLSEPLLSELGVQVRMGLADPEVIGIVITHGTDTMEETATFLEFVCGGSARNFGKKVVLTGAMLPSDHPQADGPGNLSDAIEFAGKRDSQSGIWAVMGSKPILGLALVKGHSSQTNAFFGEALPNDWVQVSNDLPIPPDNQWPWVEIITSHSGGRPETVKFLEDHGVQGIVLAGTGAGTVHEKLATPLERFIEAGGAVVRASRIGRGYIGGTLPNGRLAKALSAGYLNPAKARIALQLALFAATQSGANPLSWQDYFARMIGLSEFR